MLSRHSDDDVTEFLEYMIKNEAKIKGGKAASIAGQFGRLDFFKATDFLTGELVRADGTKITLNREQRKRLEQLKRHVNESSDIKGNWIRYFADNFVKTQLENINGLSLAKMNMNPFLIRALKLQTPEEVIRFNVYQTATRSIVTSMGFTIEKMVGHSGARMGIRGEWYDVVKEAKELTYWIQVKSGPNDVDKDQVEHFSKQFSETEEAKNNLARLGIAYGKRGLNTISLNHIESYLGNWQERLLIGKELWEFVSDEKNYHKRVLRHIDKVSATLLPGTSIAQEIENSITRIISEFESNYGEGKEGVEEYVDTIM